MFAGPQSRYSFNAGQFGKNAADIIAKTSNQNVQLGNAAANQAADIANKYQVVWRTDMVSAGTAVGSPITATQLALTIPPDVKYYFGVKALRYQAGVKTAESSVAWSSDPVATNNAPWGFDTTRSPLSPSAIRLLP
jgi:hypothetical protein